MLSKSRTLALSAAGLTLLVAATMLPIASASASPAPPMVRCPQITAVVGLPIATTRFATVAAGEKMNVSISGTVPAGLLTGDEISGTPTNPLGGRFTVTVTVLGTDGTTASASNTCTMAVSPSPTVTRIAGADRYDQSVKVSAAYGGADFIYLASGEKFADALSASAIAPKRYAPVLLTPAAGVTPGVLNEITRLKPKHLVIVGGPASVSEAVVAQLNAVLPPGVVVRIGGADRYEVSRNLIWSPEFGAGTSQSIFLASGANFPDALSASPIATYNNSPVLLVDGTESSLTAGETALLAHRGVRMVSLVGGPASISPALEAALSSTYAVSRYGGADRFEVSKNLITATLADAKTVMLASGMVFPDALTGGAYVARTGGPLVITQQECLSPAAAVTIGVMAPQRVIVLGGLASVSADAEHLVVCA